MIGFAVTHHVERFRHADEPRQPLRALGAGDDAERHFGQADLRAGDGHAVVAGHGQLQAAAERGAVDRHDDRLGAVFDAREEIVQIGSAASASQRQRFEGPDVGAGDERPSGATITTTAVTSGSAFASSMAAISASGTPGLSALTGGLST